MIERTSTAGRTPGGEQLDQVPQQALELIGQRSPHRMQVQPGAAQQVE